MGDASAVTADAFLIKTNMKRYRKRIVPEYNEKYADYEPEFYGVFLTKESGRVVSVKVDPKRMRKTGLIDNDTYNEIQKVNRNTPYFHPAKKIMNRYCFDVFRYKIEGLRRLWNQEIKPAIDKITTPKEAGDQAFLGSIADGVLEYDECESVRFFTALNREPNYNYALRMFYAQFLLLIGASIESVMVQVITEQGYTEKKFSRELLGGYVSGHVAGLDYTKFDNHCYYDKTYKIWNFLKHNNTDVYNKIKETYPELLINPNANYKNGDLAIRYLKLSEELIMELLDGLQKFFDEFCNKVFGETTDYPEWNTEEYYARIVDDMIEDVTNPLGLPWYV